MTTTTTHPRPSTSLPARSLSARVRPWVTGRVRTVRAMILARQDDGMATAEYAIATIAAVGFAGLLITVLKSATVKGLLTGLITSALSIG
ncbi:DUF4244 domain-containing protein [Sanguibacter antarcticus]|uniref:Uncharacterized protein DUF4244 n=1 Tax=Sanguibacter antarcticus TaxID=372484 RepID=A0A2A9EA89_9MICO|nr:DUF4244 domain-containing protein [Sanguibacter antarcticus]PFG35162.1 uncharacterized protein DUF4244 [Sanguibacter antarcticus]